MNKKILAAAAVLAFAAPAFAASGVYVQADAGYGKVKIKTDTKPAHSVSKGSFSPRLGIGYDFGNNLRLGVDYTHYKPSNYNYSDGYYSSSAKVKPRSLGVSLVYDIPVSEQFKPYVGARVSVNRVSAELKEQAPGFRRFSESRETKTGTGILAGVGYSVTDNVTLDAGYRYNYWGKYENVKINSNEFSAGVRVKF